MHGFRRITLCTFLTPRVLIPLAAGLAGLLFFAPFVSAAGPATFTILHTNDLHSHLAGQGPDAYFTPLPGDGDPVQGHYARLAHLIREIRKERTASGEALLTVDSGDADYGSLFHLITPATGSSLAPEWQFFQDLGYDAMGMGNHSFEGTEAGLMMAFAKAASAGIRLPLLASNLVFNKGSEPFRALRNNRLSPASSTRFQQFLVRDLPAASGTIRVGIIGLVGPNAARLSLANRLTLGFVGLDDLTGKSDSEALYERVRELLVELRQGYRVDVVIALFHGGEPEDEELAVAVPDLDVIIAGHTHQCYVKRVGRTLIAQSGWGGGHLGVLDLSWASGTITLRNEGRASRVVDDTVPSDPDILTFVETCRQEVDRLRVSASLSYATPIFKLDRNRLRGRWPDNEAGRFVTNELRQEINRRLSVPIDVYLSSFGLIRSDFRTVGGQPTLYQYSDIFRCFPLGFDPTGKAGAPVFTFWLSRADLKSLLETMAVFSPQTSSYEPVTSDSLTWSRNSWGIPFFSKISDLRLLETPIGNATTPVHVAADDFFVRNLQKIGLISHGMVTIQPLDASGTPVATFPTSDLPLEADLLAIALQGTKQASGEIALPIPPNVLPIPPNNASDSPRFRE
ncbi:MAG: metallophosphoesterase [Candidatus Ozemobacteraceae bacterium]